MKSILKIIIELLIASIGSGVVIKFNLQPEYAYLTGGATMWIMMLIQYYLWGDK